MAYPASQQIKADALQEVNRTALHLRSDAQNRVTTMAVQSVSGTYVLGIMGNMRNAVLVFDKVASIPGIAAYAQEQFESPTLDVAAEFAAMRAAAVDVRDWIIANLPATSGFIEIRSLAADGVVEERMFTPAQTAGLRTQLDTLIATIS